MEEGPSGDQPAPVRRPGYVEGLHLSYLLAAPTHGLLPLARRLTGRTRVQAGSYLVLPVTAWVHGRVRRFQRAAGRTPRQRSAAGWFLVTWQVAAPVLASSPRRTVVLRGRSPLWGYLLDLVVGAVVDELVRRRVRRRLSPGP